MKGREGKEEKGEDCGVEGWKCDIGQVGTIGWAVVLVDEMREREEGRGDVYGRVT